MYNKTTLNSGLTVATHHMPNRVSVSAGIWVKTGSRYEEKGINGISHFLEHLLFKGTKTRTCDQIKQAIEGIGGLLNGFTAEEMTCYLSKVPERHLDSALDVLGDMVLNASLAGEDIEMERRVILEEIRMYKDLPAHLAMELLNRLLWPKHPLGRNIAGESESVTKMSREQLLEYKQTFYQPENIVVAVCGSLRHSQVLSACEKSLFAGKKSLKDKPRPCAQRQAKFSPVRHRQIRPQLKFLIKDTEQTHLALGLHGLPRAHPERLCLWLLHIILGANMSSRLFSEVRERRGLAYEIGTGLRFFQDAGAFVVHAGVDNAKAVEAMEVILEQLREIKKNKVKQEELERAKEYYVGQLMLLLEDTSDHMLWMGENFVSLNKFFYPEKVFRKVKAIQPDELQRLAEKLLQNCGLNLALVGPLKDKAQKRIEERLAI